MPAGWRQATHSLRAPRLVSPEHSSPSGGKIVVTNLGETDQLIAVGVAGIASEEEGDIHVHHPSPGYHPKLPAEPLWMRKTYDAGRCVMPGAVAHCRKVVEDALFARRCRSRVAWIKFAPKHREEPVRPKTRCEQQPVAGSLRKS